MARPRRHPARKPLALIAEQIKTPPFSEEARIEAGTFLSQIQDGESLPMPYNRPMSDIGPGCHELRIKDKGGEWRILYQITDHEILVVRIFKKKTPKTPKQEIELAKKRIAAHARTSRSLDSSPETDQ